ncbi:hypothetical protein CW304_07525 [Bacillus sp. UFRGS-B20]|nr:hypothetical protein CW304_07525 [Bacillus sp. UFRGS-B20]
MPRNAVIVTSPRSPQQFPFHIIPLSCFFKTRNKMSNFIHLQNSAFTFFFAIYFIFYWVY